MSTLNVSHQDLNDAKPFLNANEWNIANGRRRNGDLTPLSEERANEIFAFFYIGRSLKDISQIVRFDYHNVIATAIHYRWFDKVEELKSAEEHKPIQNMAQEMANKVFWMSMTHVNREIDKMLQDPNYVSPLVATNIKELNELLAVTMKANNIQCMLSNTAKVQINNSNNNQTAVVGNEAKPVEAMEAETLALGNEIVENEDAHTAALKAIQERKSQR